MVCAAFASALRNETEAEGLVVQGGDRGVRAFWGTKGAWGMPGPSAAGAVLGDAVTCISKNSVQRRPVNSWFD